MKKKLIIVLACFLLCGCDLFNSNSKEKIAYTTLYPFTYATKYMYSNFAEVTSIYPSGADISSYKLTKKQKDLYSNGNTFIYAGLSDEVNLAVEFLNSNSDLQIIDATKGVNYNYDISELWLNPSNYLMVARNIKSTLEDYETSVYNKDKIEKLYQDLKIEISEIDVELTMMGKNASKNTILVSDDALLFLEKYNIRVLSIDSDNESSSKSYSEAKKLISSGNIKYIFVLSNKTLSQDIENYIASNGITKLEINSLYTLSDEDKSKKENYNTIMKKNIEQFKTELFR